MQRRKEDGSRKIPLTSEALHLKSLRRKSFLSSMEKSTLKGPKHDQVEYGFFYTNQTHMVR
jgi:hypothetical protein